MPAYRSPAEAEIRTAAVARLRYLRPNARIIHEINCDGQTSNRIDLVAVDEAEIIAVEIKSEKDKLTRLPAQIAAMQGVAHHVIAALHQKFLVEQVTNQWAAHYQRDGVHYLRRLPDGFDHSVHAWVYPELRRNPNLEGHDDLAKWKLPHARFEQTVPHGALNLLWRDELAALCARLRISHGRRSTMSDMSTALRWHCTGKELTRGICAMLRARDYEKLEADPAIVGVAA